MMYIYYLRVSVELKNWFRILSAVAVMMKVVTVILYIIQGAYTAQNGTFLFMHGIMANYYIHNMHVAYYNYSLLWSVLMNLFFMGVCAKLIFMSG